MTTEIKNQDGITIKVGGMAEQAVYIPDNAVEQIRAVRRQVSRVDVDGVTTWVGFAADLAWYMSRSEELDEADDFVRGEHGCGDVASISSEISVHAESFSVSLASEDSAGAVESYSVWFTELGEPPDAPDGDGLTLHTHGPMEGFEGVFIPGRVLARIRELRERLPLVQLPGESAASITTAEMLNWYQGARDDLMSVGYERGNAGFGKPHAYAAEIDVAPYGLRVSRVAGSEHADIDWKRLDNLRETP